MEIKKFGFYFALGIIIVIGFKFLDTIEMFFPAILGACVLAYLFKPLYLLIYKYIKHTSLSAFVVIFIAFMLIIVPVTFIFIAIQSQIQSFFTNENIQAARQSLEQFEQLLKARLGITLSDYYISDLLPRAISAAQQAITTLAPKMIFSISGMILSAFVTFFILYYLLINGPDVLAVFKDYFPLSYENSDKLLDEMGKNTRSLILGQLLVAMMQGFLGAIGFVIFGLGGAMLWGFAMMLVAFLPFLGTFLIWFPACLLLVSRQEYFSAIGLFAWGAMIVGTSDNFVRPKLTSSLGKIHPVTVLLGVFIGLKEWGVVGLVIGPLTISVLLSLIRMFREEYIEE